jgi:cellobiose phosphorylase
VEYFDSDGHPLGSQRNRTGQIYAYGQAWAILCGFAPPERAAAALESVCTRLNTRHGIKLRTPGFNGYDPGIGGVSTYPPGAKENGGIFLHVNPWVMIAETLVGNGDRAYQYYDQINPAAKNDSIEVYECEPYVYAQNILGDEHPQFGLGRNSWLSGTATWAYQAATQYILGIQPTYRGLRRSLYPARVGRFQDDAPVPGRDLRYHGLEPAAPQPRNPVGARRWAGHCGECGASSGRWRRTPD